MKRMGWLAAVVVSLGIGCGGEVVVPEPDASADLDASMADAGPSCGPGQLVCDARCTDVDRDREHCGACDAACGDGEVCVAGACELSCPSELDECSGSCRDLATDRAHCGACGVACEDGEVCSAGTCALSCSTGLDNCSGSCRDLLTDRAHCGACGAACEAGEICEGGTCVLSCEAGLDACSGSCRDLQSDRANCGACGTVCNSGEVCSAGACALSCEAGLDDCSGSCRDLQADRANCGACGTVCDAGEVCSAGVCALSCEAGLDDCSGSCRDLQTDRAHCGICGSACDAGEVCSTGTCTLSCEAGLTDCTGSCRDLQTDRAHCGGCGMACPAGQLCSAGACVATCDAVDCSAYDTACTRAVCVVSGGEARCEPRVQPNGTACDAYTSSCTTGATCLGAACVADSLNGVAPACVAQGIALRGSGATAIRGNADGFWLEENACGAGQALIGFRGVHSGFFAGSWIKEIRGICGTISAAGTAVTVATAGELPAHGVNASGTPWSTTCPANQVVVGFDGRAGSALDAVGVRCAPITITASGTTTISTGTVTAQPLAGGGGGSAFASTDCPAGEIATAQRVVSPPGSNPSLGLSLRCSDLELVAAR